MEVWCDRGAGKGEGEDGRIVRLESEIYIGFILWYYVRVCLPMYYYGSLRREKYFS